jgi:hypothetical protein
MQPFSSVPDIIAMVRNYHVFGFIVVVAFAFVVIAVIVVLKPIVDIQG